MKSASYFLSLIASSTCLVGTYNAMAEEHGMPGNLGTMDETQVSGEAADRARDTQQGARMTPGYAPSADEKQALKSTAQNQSSKPESLQITRQIRKQIMDQRELSTTAKNVKVITDDNGAVTLRGPVKNSAERDQLEQIARNNATGGQVDNQLVVKSEEESKGAAHG
jgi:osmotically-inducible protein OsmY